MAKQRLDPVFVAVVDDDTSLCHAIDSLLRSAGFTVQCFASAEEFLSAPEREQAECLILDILLPGISGLELQRRLVAAGNRIPIVFVTGEVDEDGHRRAQALQAGAVAFLRKPFGVDELLSAVRSRG